MTTIIEGGCFCGAVRYRATAAPWGSMVCHCNTCRRVCGAPAVAWLTFPVHQFSYTKGEPGTLQSSALVQRTFCTACGSQLTFKTQKSPEEIDVTTSTLDDPSAYPPSHHSWMSHNIEWLRFGDGLPTYPQSRSSS